MTTAVQRRRGTSTEHSTFTGLDGEITVNTTTYTAHIHDGATVGGVPLAKADGSNIVTSSIDINGGTIDNAIIGGTTAAAVTTTALVATTADINGGTIDGTVIGGTTAAAGTFTTGQFDTSVNVDGTVTADGLTVESATGAEVTLKSTDSDGASGEYVGKLHFEGSDSSGGASGVRAGIYAQYGSSFGYTSLDLLTSISGGSLKKAMTISGDGDISFYEDTGTTAKLYWDASAERLGLGTSSPAARLEIRNDSAGASVEVARLSNNGAGANTKARLNFFAASTNYGAITGGFGASAPEMTFDIIGGTHGNFIWTSASTERMRINSSGNVGIGTSSPSTRLNVVAPPGGSATVSGNFRLIAFLHAAQTGSPGLRVGYNESSKNAVLAGTEQAGGGGGGLETWTFNGSAWAERVRIDSSGNLLIGYTSSNGAYKLQVNSQIFATSATIATSDGRYKENVEPLSGALDLVAQLNPVQFDWKEHPVHNFDRDSSTVGFIAQEVQSVLADKPYLNSIVKRNECVIEPEETDDDGNVIKDAVTEEFFGIAEGNMVALLTKAIQELKAEFDAYKEAHP